MNVETEKSLEVLLTKVMAITGSDRMPEKPVTEQAATEPALEEDTQTQASYEGGFSLAQRQTATNHCMRVLEESYARTLMADQAQVWWLDSYQKQYVDFDHNVNLLWYKVERFVDENIWDHLYECSAEQRVTDLRRLTFETKKAFDHMQAQTWTPET